MNFGGKIPEPRKARSFLHSPQVYEFAAQQLCAAQCEPSRAGGQGALSRSPSAWSSPSCGAVSLGVASGIASSNHTWVVPS